MAWGSPEKNLGTWGGARGMAGAVADRWWGVDSRRAGRRRGAGRPRAAGAGGSAGGGWRLRGWRLKINCRPSLNYM